MNLLKIVFICLFIAIIGEIKAGNVSQIDSIGIETKNGKTYIIHKVKSGETLYSLSRRYNAKVSEILATNPSAKAGIKAEQILKIPYIKKAPLPVGATYHDVKSKESMYAISKKYGVKLSDIKKWNNLTSTPLNVGQRLVIYPAKEGQTTPAKIDRSGKIENREQFHTVGASETLYSISKKYKVSIVDLKQWNGLSSVSLKVGQKLVIKQPLQTAKAEVTTPAKKAEKEVKRQVDKTSVVKSDANSDFKDYESSMEDIKRVNNKPVVKPKSKANSFNKVIELGFAEVIKTEKNSKKWLALHRKAPIGTILRVKNEMNNLWVFVRVVGKLPETSVNDKVLIKLSKTAYDKLGAINDRFPVEISYIP